MADTTTSILAPPRPAASGGGEPIDHPAEPPSSQLLAGTLFGLCAAVHYTLSNYFLKQVAHRGDLDWSIWVMCNKALPAAVAAWAIIAWRSSRGLPALPSRNVVLPLIGAGLVMQFGGNMLFQMALARGGLALTVPLVFSTIILSGATAGRIFLGETLNPRTLLAMAMLIIAIVLLSQGAEAASESVRQSATTTDMVLAVLFAGLSGLGYGTGGVMMRHFIRKQASLSATLVLIATTGVVGFGLLSLMRFGVTGLLATDPSHWLAMLGAGIANAIAFFAIAAALKRLTVTRVNLINASQSAMAAVVAVMVFDEALTPWLIAGVALTMLGLAAMPRKDGV